jgi:hypothetical protein
MRARFYDPNLGRFLTPDPAGLVDGPNLYAYSGNDPVNFIDPTGLARQATQDNPGLSKLGLVHFGGMLPLLSQLIGGVTITGEDVTAFIHEFGVQLGTSLLDKMPQGSGLFARAARFGAVAAVSALQSALDVVGGLLATVADPGMALRGLSRLGEGTAAGLQQIEKGNWVMGVSMITAEVTAVIGIAAGGVGLARGAVGMAATRQNPRGRAPGGGQPLYRGVPGPHTPRGRLGQQGIAEPRGTALDPVSLEKHVRGDPVKAGVTSWTTKRNVAKRFSGTEGTIIEVDSAAVRNRVVPRPPVPKYFDESEVLLRGRIVGKPTTP